MMAITAHLPFRLVSGEHVMAQGKVVFAGLNQTGVITFVVLLLLCWVLAWIPWVVDSMKGDPNFEE